MKTRERHFRLECGHTRTLRVAVHETNNSFAPIQMQCYDCTPAHALNRVRIFPSRKVTDEVADNAS